MAGNDEHYGLNPRYNGNNTRPPTAADIAAELTRRNPTLIRGTPRSTAYNANPYTVAQLQSLSSGASSNGFNNAYTQKMAGYGLNQPLIMPTPPQGGK